MVKLPYGLWIPLLPILFVALAIRSSSLGDSLWIDELHTAWVVAGEASDVLPRAMIGNQSPVAYWPLWTWIQASGLGEQTLRLPMLLAGLGTIALGYGFVLRGTNSLAAAITTGLLIALDDKCVYYSVEARVYAFVQLAALGHIGLFVSLLQEPTWWRRVTWVLLGALLLHLHYTAGLLLIAEWTGYGLIRWFDQNRPIRYRWPNLALDSGLILLALTPMLGHIADIASRRHNWTKFIRPAAHPITILFIVPIAKLTIAPALLLLVFRPSPCVEVQDTNGTVRDTNGIVRDPNESWDALRLLLCCAWMLIPVLTAWLLSYTEIARLYYPPYLMTAMCAPMVVTGLLVAAAGRPFQRSVMAIIAVVIGLLGNATWREPILSRQPAITRNEPWRVAIEALNEQIKHSPKPVFIGTGYIECDNLKADGQDDPLLREYCYLPVRTGYWLNCPDDQIHPLRLTHPGQLSPRDAQVASRSGGWFLVRNEASDAFRRDVEASLRKSDPQVRAQWRTRSFGLLTLLELVIVREGAHAGESQLRGH